MRRLLMLLSAVCLVLATAACSGDDGKDDKDKDAKATEGSTLDPKEARKRMPKTKACTAEVRTTGAYEAEWKGDAQVRTGGKSVDATGPNAVYSLNDKKNRVALYSPGPEFKGSVSLSADGVAYSSDPADADSLDIDKRGKHAEVDVTLTATTGDTVDLVAEFTCGKTKKKKG